MAMAGVRPLPSSPQPRRQRCMKCLCCGPLATARDILATEGPTGFLNGALTRGLYWAPAIGIFLSCYCSVRQQAVGLGLFSLTPPS